MGMAISAVRSEVKKSKDQSEKLFNDSINVLYSAAESKRKKF